MTKTFVIGATYQNFDMPIEFKSYLDASLGVSFGGFVRPPSQFKYIELICKKYNGGMDLMFAYNDPSNRNDGILYIGYWTNGTVR